MQDPKPKTHNPEHFTDDSGLRTHDLFLRKIQFKDMIIKTKIQIKQNIA